MDSSIKLKVEYVDINKLVPYAKNAKEHSDEQVGYIENSIEEFGFSDPIGVWTGDDGSLNIVEGHGRVLAAKDLGIEKVPIIKLDHLTDKQRRAYVHVHNQTNLSSGFDDDILWEDLDTIDDYDWDDFGFDIDDTIEEYTEVEEDDFDESVVEKRCEPGDIWQLGEHRLVCGDCTDKLVVDAVMGGSNADICFTSPPYNMNVNVPFDSAPNIAMGAGAAYASFSDDLTDDEYANMLIKSTRNALDVCDDVMMNIGILAGSKQGLASMLNCMRDKLSDIVVWNKSQSMPHGMESQRGMLSHRCELIFCFNRNGSRAFSHPQWDKGTGINRIDTGNASGNKYAKEHAATFPVGLAAEVIKNFTDDSVLDMFAGTGTTLIAAEQLGRVSYNIELDPHYCDIILARYEDTCGGSVKMIGNINA